MKNRLILSSIFLSCILFFILDIFWGSVIIPWNEIVNIFQNEDSIYKEIILNIRLPRAITAVIVGASLSVSGLIMQTLFRNPLADPYVLGVSSGASLGVAILLMFPSLINNFIIPTNGWSQIIAASIVSGIILLIIIGVSLKIIDTVSLLLIGVMLGSITGAIVNILQSISNPHSLKNFIVWSMGSLSLVTWEQLEIIVPIVCTTLFCCVFITKNLDSLLLGENYAKTLGIPVFKTKIISIIIASVLAGATTAFTGPIAFIGIIVAHIARGLFKTSLHKITFPACILCGISVLLLCDIASHIPGSSYVIPINSICAIIGAPIIIWIIFKNKKTL